MAKPILGNFTFSWTDVRDYLLIAIGAFLQAFAIQFFLVPAKLVNGGVAGIAQLINYSTGWPIGVMIFLGNLPLLLLGWKYLGGPRFAFRTAYAVILISIFTDQLAFYAPENGITSDLVLNTLYGGLVSGIGYGLVYRGRGTSGGTDILARILNRWRGISLSQSYLVTDAAIMFIAGLTISWENALYALVMLYVSGVVAEVITEGSNVVRTVVIVTSKPKLISDRILIDLERGVTIINAVGGYTGEERTMLYCVISRSEVTYVKELVHEEDPQAFLVIGQANEALGEGFHKLSP